MKVQEGCPLGFWIFCFMIDRAGPRSNTESIGQTITKPLKGRKCIEKTKKEWVDDFSLLASIDLKKNLVSDPAPIHPVPWRGRHHQILPLQDNSLQYEVDLVKKYSDDRKMLLNPKKTKTMLFNTLRNYDFSPEISITHGENIEVVEQHKILGQIIRSDLKTITNTESICKKAFKAFSRMWILRRLKASGWPKTELLHVLRE